jgi:hypothetical protein
VAKHDGSSYFEFDNGKLDWRHSTAPQLQFDTVDEAGLAAIPTMTNRSPELENPFWRHAIQGMEEPG